MLSSNLSASFFIALDYFLALIIAHFDEKCTVYREFYRLLVLKAVTNFGNQAFAKIHHHRRIKRRLSVVKGFVAAEVLEVRILLNLYRYFGIGVTVLRLNDSRTETKAKRLRNIAFLI